MKQLQAKAVMAHCAHNPSVKTELTDMISKIGRCSSDFFTAGKQIPQSFANSDDDGSFLIYIAIIHNVNANVANNAEVIKYR